MAAKSTKQSVNKKAATKKPQKRTTAKVFDLLFKDLLHLSNRAVVSFINGLFGTKYPPNAQIEYLNTERVNKKNRRRTSDIMLRIRGIMYHIEAQINYAADMMIRVFEYGFDAGILQKTYDGNIRTIEFPQARVIYLESSEKNPEKQILRLKFPDHSCYDYTVESFNLLNHRVSELERRGFAILLPFYVLKLRGQIKRTKTSEERKAFSQPLKKLVANLLSAVDNLRAKNKIDEDDVPTLINGLERLYSELFSRYDELAEGDVMLSEKLDYYTDKFVAQGEQRGEQRGEQKAKLEIAKNFLGLDVDVKKIVKATGLPLETVKDLQKKLKGKTA